MKTKTKALSRGVLFVGTLSFLTLAAFFLSTVAQAASTDYFLKIDGVEGESTKSTTETQPLQIQTSPYRPVEEAKPTPGVEPDEIDVAADGTSKPTPVPGVEREEIGIDDGDGGEENATNFGVLLGGSDSGEEKGKVEASWKVEEGTKISVSAVEVRGWDPEKKQEFLGEVKANAELKTPEDLENFARGVLLEDENITDIEFRNDGLEVAYRATGKILGIIPVSFTERVVAAGEDGAEPEVRVLLPWWGFLLAPDVAPGDIEAEVKKGHKNEIDIVSWSWGASNAGSYVTLISNVLKTKHDTVKNSINNVR